MSNTAPKPFNQTASFSKGLVCNLCGWPVICACNNDEMKNVQQCNGYDWLLYCSNKGCKNHEGHGWPTGNGRSIMFSIKTD